MIGEMDVITISIIGFLIICGVLNYGFTFACFQKKYSWLAHKHYYYDMIVADVMFFGGSVMLCFIILRGDHKYGLKFI